MLKFDDRFARQNRYEPPPEFPLALPYSSIAHHLSGPNMTALTLKRQKNHQFRLIVQVLPILSLSLSLRSKVCHPVTRNHVRLLGPCFKTGHLISFNYDPVLKF
jgi:hypothetical protein